MFRHYRNLVDAGFRRYISINRFDVARAASRYDDLGASPRFRSVETSGEGVLMLIPKPSGFWTSAGTVVQLGEAGAVLQFVDKEQAAALRSAKIRAGDPMVMTFMESGRQTQGRIIEVDVSSEPALLEVQFSSLQSLSDLAEVTPLPTVPLRLRLISSDDSHTTADQLGRRLYVLFELVDEIRYVVNLAAIETGRSDEYSAPPVVQRLTVASPADAVLLVSQAVRDAFPIGSIAAVLTFALKLPGLRKQWHEGTAIALDNDHKREAKELRALKRQRKALEEAVLEELISARRDGRAMPDGVETQLRGTITSRVLPLIGALAEAGVEALDSPTFPSTKSGPSQGRKSRKR